MLASILRWPQGRLDTLIGRLPNRFDGARGAGGPNEGRKALVFKAPTARLLGPQGRFSGVGDVDTRPWSGVSLWIRGSPSLEGAEK